VYTADESCHDRLEKPKRIGMNFAENSRVLLSAWPRNAAAVAALAAEHGLGVELLTFALPDVLDGDLPAAVAAARHLLAPVPGMIALHGPFFDMSPGSVDARVNALTMQRYRQALEIAQQLGACVVVFHANFIASLKGAEYRSGWQQRNTAFFRELADFAGECGVTAAIENMWEFDPEIIGEVLAAVDHPHLRACLDVGHAHLFSTVPFTRWLDVLRPWLVHTHLNNNEGVLDIHRAFPDGVLDYAPILAALRGLPAPPSMTLEMESTDDMLASLPYLHLSAPAARTSTQAS